MLGEFSWDSDYSLNAQSLSNQSQLVLLLLQRKSVDITVNLLRESTGWESRWQGWQTRHGKRADTIHYEAMADISIFHQKGINGFLLIF